MAVQVFLNGFAYHVSLLAVKNSPALGNILYQSIIQLGIELYLDLRHICPERALVVLIGDFPQKSRQESPEFQSLGSCRGYSLIHPHLNLSMIYQFIGFNNAGNATNAYNMTPISPTSIA